MPPAFPLVQFPNPPLIVAVVAGAAARLAPAPAAGVADAVSKLGLIVWAYQEVVDGANWFRQLLGVAGTAYGVGTLVNRVRG
jgi:hypothetical protein